MMEMSTKEESSVGDQENEEKSYMLEAFRKMTLAAIGTLSIAHEEIENLVQKLVERGEIAEHDGRKLVEELKERKEKRFARRNEAIEKRVEELLDKLNVPTKDDINNLSKKVSALTRKVDNMMKKEDE